MYDYQPAPLHINFGHSLIWSSSKNKNKHNFKTLYVAISYIASEVKVSIYQMPNAGRNSGEPIWLDAGFRRTT